MTITRLSEPSFKALLALTSVRDGSATQQALYRHLVLGYPKQQAIEEVGISIQAMNKALRLLSSADAAARLYIESLDQKSSV